MATQVQFRRGTTSQTSSFIGAVGEVTVDTTKNTLIVHNAVQAGGFPVLRDDGTNSALTSGSLSNCALKFAGDSNTGIISPSSDNISLVTGGVARLTIDGSGSVTIPGNLIVSGTLTATATSFSDQIALILALG